jgi:hypothetical protein
MPVDKKKHTFSHQMSNFGKSEQMMKKHHHSGSSAEEFKAKVSLPRMVSKT